MDIEELKKYSDTEIADAVSAKLDADIILYNGALQRPKDRDLIGQSIQRRRRENVVLILVSSGGDADVAYRIARCLQQKYKKFSLYVSGFCKSAATLVALGAHELIMSDHGELGPLDVQLSKKDELWETRLGLTVMTSLTSLNDKAYLAFEKFLLETKARSGGAITMGTAAEIATKLTTGLFSPLYSQIDPLHVGEAGRAMSVASHYGQRLIAVGQNATLKALEFLVSEYPSHGFVIDRKEADALFVNVREPTIAEAVLAERIGDNARWPAPFGNQPVMEFLSSEPQEAATEAVHRDKQAKGETDERPKPATRAKPGEAVADAGEQPEASDGKQPAVNVTPITRGG